MRRTAILAFAVLLALALGAGAALPAEPQPASKPGPKPGEVWREPSTGMEFVWVPGGCFSMGSPAGTGRDNERPEHEACLDGFWMGRFEVTQGAWKKVMGSNPARFPKGDEYPVDSVNWSDAREFAERLSEASGGKFLFRLPSEAQWEYACTGAGRGAALPGEGAAADLGWLEQNSGNITHKVGGKPANAQGIHDMAGNVWEWTEDGYEPDAYARHARQNPFTKGRTRDRVVRGGSWRTVPDMARCGYRLNATAGHATHDMGLRLARLR